MRKLSCYEVVGLSVSEILSEFNERAEELGVTEENLVSVSAMAPTRLMKILDGGKTKEATVQVAIVYWSDQ